MKCHIHSLVIMTRQSQLDVYFTAQCVIPAARQRDTEAIDMFLLSKMEHLLHPTVFAHHC